ncbi:MAG: hypothetical protein H6746_07265 [Deltaproteobacteria bacterium]|nr:hypothetical protein [Deltaproteobacteria bacterium]
MSNMTREMAFAAIRRHEPSLTHDELVIRFVRLHYGEACSAMVSRCMEAKRSDEQPG